MSTEMVDGLLDFACGAAGWVTLHGLMKEMPWDWNEQLRRFRLAAGQNDRSRRPRLSRLNSLVAAQRSSWLAMVGRNVACKPNRSSNSARSTKQSSSNYRDQQDARR
jgi:hypothetical protein